MVEWSGDRWQIDTDAESVGAAEQHVPVEFHAVSKWYGHVIGVNNLSLRLPTGRDRAARTQRRGQEHAAATGDRPAPAQPGRGARARASALEQRRAEPAASDFAPSKTRSSSG